jgi:hypothetical protein
LENEIWKEEGRRKARTNREDGEHPWMNKVECFACPELAHYAKKGKCGKWRAVREKAVAKISMLPGMHIF